MATKLKTKKFTSEFERWVGVPPAGCRFMFNDAVTGKPYWITREDFLNGFNGTSDSGASAYQIYAATTSDNPVLSETAWIDSLYGQDGVTPTIGSNGNWFIGTTDTGVKAQPENPIPAAQIYNAPMGVVIFFVGLLSSLSDSWHLANGDVVEGFGTTVDMRGKVPLGYDDRKSATPTSNPGMIENYGAIGNTGGQSSVTLTKDQIPALKVTLPGQRGGDNNDNSNITAFAGGDKGQNETGFNFTIDVNTEGSGQAHENRMEYVVGAYIQRVKPEVLSGGGSGTTLTADQLQIINTVPLICSDENKDLIASTDESVIHFVFQTPQSFTKIVGELNVAAAGGTFTVVAKKNGVSFLSTDLTFDSGESTTRTASVPFVFTTPTVSFAVGDYVDIFIISIGSVIAGKGLKIYLM